MKKFAIFAASMLGCAMMSAQPAPGSFEQTWTRGPEWLRDGVIYQVYPSSYKDSDGNGIGDIRGVISELDYIESLGVRAIWFNSSSSQDGLTAATMSLTFTASIRASARTTTWSNL